MKAKYLLILFLAAGLFVGCDGEKSGDAATVDNASAENAKAPEDNTAAPVEGDAEAPAETAAVVLEQTYTFHDVTYDEVLSVWKKSGDIEFVIEVTNSENGCSRQVKGIATAKEGDLESRDVDGEAIFVQEYLYDSPDCSLVISLDMDAEAYAWISEGDCKDSDPLCRLDVGSHLSMKQ